MQKTRSRTTLEIGLLPMGFLGSPENENVRKNLRTNSFFRKGGSQKVIAASSDAVDPRHSAKARPRHVRGCVKGQLHPVRTEKCSSQERQEKNTCFARLFKRIVYRSRPKEVPANSSPNPGPNSSPSSTGRPWTHTVWRRKQHSTLAQLMMLFFLSNSRCNQHGHAAMGVRF